MNIESFNQLRRQYLLTIRVVSQDIARRNGIVEPGPVNIEGVWYSPNEWMGMRLGRMKASVKLGAADCEFAGVKFKAKEIEVLQP